MISLPPMLSSTRKNFQVRDFLGQRWIQAAAALLDERKVEACGIGNRLEVVRNVTAFYPVEVIVVYRNSWMLSLGEIRNGVLEGSTEIRIRVRAAVTGPPFGFDG